MSKNEIYRDITNWKIREVLNYVQIIDNDSSDFIHKIIQTLQLPKNSDYTGIIRNETIIDWNKLNIHFSFYFDREGWEERIKQSLNESLKHTSELIITYGYKEPVIMIPTEIFLESWDDFFSSTHYETIIFSKDYKYIMEVSRDYYLHSNFFICKDV